MEKEIRRSHQTYLGVGDKSSAANKDWQEFSEQLPLKEIISMYS